MTSWLTCLLVVSFGHAQDWVTPPPGPPAVGDVFVPGPAGAQILVDGKPTGLAAPSTVEQLSVGPHVIGLRRDCDGVDIPVTVRKGSIERAEAALVRGPASVAIAVSVDGASVWLDGMSLGPAPVAIQHTACGTHVVEAEAPGYSRATAEVKLSYGESLPLTLTLSAVQLGNVAVSVRPFEAEVWVDGTRRGSGPMTVNALPIGLHQVEARAKGYDPGGAPVNVVAGETARVDLSLLPSRSFAERTGLDRVDWPRVGVGTGLAAAAIGSGVFAATQFVAADLGYEAYAQLNYLDDTEAFYAEQVERPTLFAYGLTGAAVACAGGSTYMFATLKPTAAPASIQAVPTPSGVTVTGTF